MFAKREFAQDFLKNFLDFIDKDNILVADKFKDAEIDNYLNTCGLPQIKFDNFAEEIAHIKISLENYSYKINQYLKEKYPEGKIDFYVEMFDKTDRNDLIDKIIKETNQLFNVDITSASRKQHYVKARFIAIFFIRKSIGVGLKHLGSKLGERDHATILNAITGFENRFETEPLFREEAFKYLDHMKKLGYISPAYELNYSERFVIL